MLRAKLQDLENDASGDLWASFPARAQALMQQVTALKADVAQAAQLEALSADALTAVELADLSSDPAESEAMLAEAQGISDQLERLLGQWLRKQLLSEPYDERPVRLSIQAGAGGTDAQDWAEMLEVRLKLCALSPFLLLDVSAPSLAPSSFS